MDVPVLLNARARVESGTGQNYIVLESNESLAEPIVQLTLEIRCDKTGNVTRQYILLSDPHESFLKTEQPPVQPVLLPPPLAVLPADVGLVAPAEHSPAAPAVSAPRSSKPAAPVAQLASIAQDAKVLVPAGPMASAGAIPPARTRKPRVVRDVLRLEPPGDDAEGRFGSAEGGCCFRLSYELGEREGAPVTEEERDRLRMEFAERMGEGEILQKLLEMRDRVQVLKGQVSELSAQLVAEEARLQSDAQSSQFAWLISGMAGIAALSAGIWLWRRSTRRERFDLEASDLFDTGISHSPGVHQADLTGESTQPETQHENDDTRENKYENKYQDNGENKYQDKHEDRHLDEREPGLPQAATPASEMPLSPYTPVATTAPALEAGLEYVSARPAAVEAAVAPVAAQPDAPGYASNLRVLEFPVVTTASAASAFEAAKVAGEESLEKPLLADREPQQVAQSEHPQEVEQHTAFDFSLSDDEISAADFDLPLDSQPADHMELTLDLEPDGTSLSPAAQRILDGERARLSDPDNQFVYEDDLFPAIVAGGETPAVLEPVMAAPLDEDLDPDLVARRTQSYRDEYIRQRFPEIAAGSIELNKPATVVEGARSMYQEDQDVARAVGLLELARSAQPKYVQLWLCLFEIYWREGMQAAFVDLARRFRDAFTEAYPEWPMIVKLGRELDPANALFRGDGLPPVQESMPNWLNAELDMVGHMLSRELRDQVLEHADATSKRQVPGPGLDIR